MDNVYFEVKVSEMYFRTIWRPKFTDFVNSEKNQSLGKNGCRQKCLDKSLLKYTSYLEYRSIFEV